MFDTEKFIIAMETKGCLWDPKIPDYGDKFFKRKAWEDLGEVMYDGYEKFSARKKKEAVQELQKKWKHLRDYYVREKRQEKKNVGYTTGLKKRKTPLLNLLSFLSKIKTLKRPLLVKSPVAERFYSEEENFFPVEEKFIPSEPTILSSDSNEEDSQFTHFVHINNDQIGDESLRSNEGLKDIFQESVLHTVEKKSAPELNPNMNFLLSILPEMNSMDERQVFEFKLEIMNVIKKIKY